MDNLPHINQTICVEVLLDLFTVDLIYQACAKAPKIMSVKEPHEENGTIVRLTVTAAGASHDSISKKDVAQRFRQKLQRHHPFTLTAHHL